MSKLIDDLTMDHLQIVRTLGELKNIGITHPDANNKLRSIKTMLIEHLKKEDTSLYPQLHEAAKSDENLKFRLNQFASEMEGITKFALEFFDKFEERADDPDMTFIKDYGRLFAMLKHRINNEETILYKNYEMLFAD